MSINRGMDKEDVVHIYSGILLSHKKEQNNAICSNMDATWMDLEMIILSEVSQTNIEYHLYVESKKMIQINLFTKQK